MRVVRLWHRNCFLGARDAGVGDPGALNVDVLVGGDGKVLAVLSWDETAALTPSKLAQLREKDVQESDELD